MSYNYSYSYSASQLPGWFFPSFSILFIVLLIAEWKIFTKAGKPGWAVIVPFYNVYTLFEIVGMPGWQFLLLLIPFVNIYIAIKVFIELAKSFGKTVGFGIGLILLSPIFLCILGFGDAKYIGSKK